VLIKSVDAEYTDAARRAKLRGTCVISLIVDAEGNPQQLYVAQSTADKGLDDNAIKAVKQYKFKPGMKDGKTPVAVRVNVEVNFWLY